MLLDILLSPGFIILLMLIMGYGINLLRRPKEDLAARSQSSSIREYFTGENYNE